MEQPPIVQSNLKRDRARPRTARFIAGLLAALILNAVAVWFAYLFFSDGIPWLGVALFVGAIGTTWVYASSRAYPLRYLWPGLVFFVLLVVYPIGYTVYVAFTNYGTGHMLSKAQVIQQFEADVYAPDDAQRYPFQAFETPEGSMRFLLQRADGSRLLLEDGVARAADPTDNLQPLTVADLARRLPELQAAVYEWGDRLLRVASLREFAEVRPAYRYDAAEGVLIDLRSELAYRAEGGYFVNEAGHRLEPGFVETVGGANFARLWRDPAVSGPFVRVFGWTIVWALLTVALQSVVGIALAILLNDPHLKLRNIYRSVLILPYAIPAFISVLMWAGLLNTELGTVNDLLVAMGLPRIPWMQDPFWARFALLLVNTWLGFPYMMLVTLGALQSIPNELYEAARVDGARSLDILRTVTMPLLMIAIAPLLVASFAFNFNNFNVIFLLTGGGPPIVGAETPAGHTDILISYAYRLAFGGGQGTQFGFAAAISIIIFLFVAMLTIVNFRLTRAFEEVSENV